MDAPENTLSEKQSAPLLFWAIQQSIHTFADLDALWRVGQCHWPTVDHRLKQSQELSLQAGDQLRWSNAQVIRFWSLFYRGDWGALEHTAQGLLSRAQSSGNIQQEIWALRCKSLCALHADRPREAIEILQTHHFCNARICRPRRVRIIEWITRLGARSHWFK